MIAAVDADTITGTARVEMNITHTGTNTATTVTEELVNVYKWGGTGAFGTNGAAAGVGRMYAATLSLGAGATNTLDLAGSLTDSFGASLTFARVKFLSITPSNSMAVAQSVLVRPAPANGWATWMSTTTSAVRVWSGGCVVPVMCPQTNAPAVTAGTGDLLDIVNESTNAATVTVIILGD
jgi:hypothetical protein